MKTQNHSKLYAAPVCENFLVSATDIIATSTLLGDGQFALPNIEIKE